MHLYTIYATGNRITDRWADTLWQAIHGFTLDEIICVELIC